MREPHPRGSRIRTKGCVPCFYLINVPLSKGRRLLVSLAQRRAPRNRSSGRAAAPPNARSPPSPSRGAGPRAPQASRERASYLCSEACGAGPAGGGRGRWVLGAVPEQRGPRGPPCSSRRLSRLSRSESSASSFWATSLNAPGQAPHFLPAAPQRSGAPSAQVPRAPPAPPAPPAPSAPPAPNGPRALPVPIRPESSGRAEACEDPMERLASEARGLREGGEEPAGCPPASLAQARGLLHPEGHCQPEKPLPLSVTGSPFLLRMTGPPLWAGGRLLP